MAGTSAIHIHDTPAFGLNAKLFRQNKNHSAFVRQFHCQRNEHLVCVPQTHKLSLIFLCVCDDVSLLNSLFAAC